MNTRDMRLYGQFYIKSTFCDGAIIVMPNSEIEEVKVNMGCTITKVVGDTGFTNRFELTLELGITDVTKPPIPKFTKIYLVVCHLFG